MIHRLVGASEPSLIFGLGLIKCGIKSVEQDSRKQFVQRWQSTDRAIGPDIFFVPSSVDNFLRFSTPCFGSAAFLLEHFVEDLSHHSFRRNVTVLDVFGTDSIVVAGFAFLEFVDCCLNFFICDQGYFSVSSSPLFFLTNSPGIMAQGILKLFFSFSAVKYFAFEFAEDICDPFSR